MIRINSNILTVSIFCCTALLMFFYYQYNMTYNQCVRVLLNEREPKYFNNSNDALSDIFKTGHENNYYKTIDNFEYLPVADDKVVNIKDYGIEPVSVTRQDRLEEVAVSVHSIGAFKYFK